MAKPITVRTAAKLLGVHPETILRRCRAGTLKCDKFGGREWRVLTDENGLPITQEEDGDGAESPAD